MAWNVVASDNFNRAEGYVGSNWTDGGTTQAYVYENALYCATQAFMFSYWDANTFGDDQQSEITIHGLNTAMVLGPVVRMSGSGATVDGYYFQVSYSSSAFRYRAFKIVNGTQTETHALTALGFSLSEGDTLLTSVEGTTVSFYINGDFIDSFTDSDLSSGYPGIMIYNNQEQSADNWVGREYEADTQNYSYSGVGGAITGGSLVLKRGRVQTSSSGGITGGAAIWLRGVKKLMAAGAITGGEATVVGTYADETQTYSYSSVGGALVGGSGPFLRGVAKSAIGGGVVGGAAPYLRGVLFSGSSGGVIGGSSPQKSGLIWTSAGGAISGGTSVMLQGVEHIAVGGGVVGGSGDQLIGATYTTIGGGVAGGTATVIRHYAGVTLTYPKIIFVDGKPALNLSKLFYIEL